MHRFVGHTLPFFHFSLSFSVGVCDALIYVCNGFEALGAFFDGERLERVPLVGVEFSRESSVGRFRFSEGGSVVDV